MGSKILIISFSLNRPRIQKIGEFTNKNQIMIYKSIIWINDINVGN